MPPELPPTVAPCPHCGKEVTSPDQNQQQESPSELSSDEQGSDEKVVRLKVEDRGPVQVRQIEDLGAPSELILDENSRRAKGGKAIWVAAIALLLVAGGLVLLLTRQGENEPSSNGAGWAQGTETAESQEEAWLTSGWKEEASKVLAAFLKARSPAERMKYVIANKGVLEELQIFYPEGSDDSDSPIESFAHRTGSENDQKKGIFLMQYRRPSLADMRDHFTPIGSLDKILGVEGSTLLDMALQINEDNISKPIGINAFFKKTDDGLKLDASVFIQGKFRTFRAFADYPRPGKKQLFRVVASESMVHELRDDKRYRTYRLDDYAYPQDYINVPVLVGSEVGNVLSSLNWRGMNRDMSFRTATVELGWSKEKPSKLTIERVICWQFLGVGGEVGNTTESDKNPSLEPATEARSEVSESASEPEIEEVTEKTVAPANEGGE